MARGLNKLEIIGNLGSDPGLRYTPSGQAVCGFSVAVNEDYTDQQGNKVEKATWVKVSAWGRLAEVCAEYLGKGSKVFVMGPVKLNEWQTRDGEHRANLELTAQQVLFVDTRPSNGGGQQGGGYYGQQGPDSSYDDDIPF